MSRQQSGAEDERSEVGDITDSYRLCQIHPLEFVDLSEQWFSAPKRGGALLTQNIFAWGVVELPGPPAPPPMFWIFFSLLLTKDDTVLLKVAVV